MISSFFNLSANPSTTNLDLLQGTYRRISCEGMEDFHYFRTGHRDKRAIVAGNVETPCMVLVQYSEETDLWTYSYMRDKMVKAFIFRWPRQAKSTGSLVKVLHHPSRTTPQPRLEVARNSAGDRLQFSESSLEEGSFRMVCSFSGRSLRQVKTLRGEDVCIVE